MLCMEFATDYEEGPMLMYWIIAPLNMPTESHSVTLKGQKEDPQQQPLPTPKKYRDVHNERELLEIHITGLYILFKILKSMSCAGLF